MGYPGGLLDFIYALILPIAYEVNIFSVFDTWTSLISILNTLFYNNPFKAIFIYS